MTRWRKFKQSRGLYRSRNGVIFGVCQGLADYFDFSVFWIRALFVLFLLLSGIWPILAIYLIATLVMKPEPVRPIESQEERDFYESYVASRATAARNLMRRYEKLERRIRRMEDTVTAKDFDWEQRMNS